MAIEEIKPQLPQLPPKSFAEMFTSADEKTRITVMLELLKHDNLEFITEYPSFQYTKAMTKYEAWTHDVASVIDLEPEYIDEIVGSVPAMAKAFMKKNVSHKRRRAQEIVNSLKGEESNTTVLNEHKSLRNYLGMR